MKLRVFTVGSLIGLLVIMCGVNMAVEVKAATGINTNKASTTVKAAKTKEEFNKMIDKSISSVKNELNDSGLKIFELQGMNACSCGIKLLKDYNSKLSNILSNLENLRRDTKTPISDKIELHATYVQDFTKIKTDKDYIYLKNQADRLNKDYAKISLTIRKLVEYKDKIKDNKVLSEVNQQISDLENKLKLLVASWEAESLYNKYSLQALQQNDKVIKMYKIKVNKR